MVAKTIEDVIDQLDVIIADSEKNNSRLGYFAALYQKVTVKVKEGIDSGQFSDGPRMEKLDVVFANRYLAAYEEQKNKGKPSSSWDVSFRESKKSSVLVLQHLMLGMNAHINLDLGIAAAEISKGKDIADIRNDFMAINMIISSLTYQVVDEIGRISPLLSLLGLHATNYNSILIQFAIDNARDGAWCFAEELAKARDDASYNKLITDRDNQTAQIGQGLVHANFLLRLTLTIIYIFEWKKPRRIIDALTNYKKIYFKIG